MWPRTSSGNNNNKKMKQLTPFWRAHFGKERSSTTQESVDQSLHSKEETSTPRLRTPSHTGGSSHLDQQGVLCDLPPAALDVLVQEHEQRLAGVHEAVGLVALEREVDKAEDAGPLVEEGGGTQACTAAEERIS